MSNKSPKVNLWKVEYVEIGKHEAGNAVYYSDTFVATTFADAAAKAEVERAKFLKRLKIKSLVPIAKVTA